MIDGERVVGHGISIEGPAICLGGVGVVGVGRVASELGCSSKLRIVGSVNKGSRLRFDAPTSGIVSLRL